MKKLTEHIAFGLEFNTVAKKSHIIQVSAVRFEEGHKVDSFDTCVYTDMPLQSFISGLTGITSEKIANTPKLDEVLADLKTFIGETALVGYDALKSNLPLLAENELDSTELYKVDLYNKTLGRRSTGLNGITSLRLTGAAEFSGISGHGHNSLEDARMATLVYEKSMEFDENKSCLNQREGGHDDSPFAALGGFFN